MTTPTTSVASTRLARAVAIAAAIALIGAPPVLHAQANAMSDSIPAAKPADVASMDAILKALYDVISGPAGPRDWQRFRTLFIPGGRLIPSRHDSTGHVRALVMTPDEFAARGAKTLGTMSFYEKQIGQTVNTFGAITQVFSAYASRHQPNDPKPFARGINSIQLFNDGTRWYVVTIFWDAERPGLTIPDKYLNGAQ